MSVSLLTIDERLCRTCGDFLQADTTTNVTTDTNIVSSSLANYDRNSTGFFDNWWVYIEEGNNAGVSRRTGATTYNHVTHTLTVFGAALAAETGAVTFRLTRTPWEDRLQAINEAIRECYPFLAKRVEDRTLVSGNALPNAHFEAWASSSYPDYYAVSDATAAETNTSTSIRGGKASAKVTASAADGYMYVDSDSYPRLLDLRGTTVSFKCWVQPEVADDAFLTIYTLKADGTAQTLNSTTACPAGKWTLLALEEQAINDDIEYIAFRFRVHTNAKYAYFDDARVTGKTPYEYLLPEDFQAGKITEVRRQTSGNSDEICDDLGMYNSAPVFGWDVVEHDGTRFLRFEYGLPSGYRLSLTGTAPYPALSSGTDTLNLTEAQVALLAEWAAYLLYARQAAPVSGDEVSRYYLKAQEHLNSYMRLRGRFGLPSEQMKVRAL